MAPVASEAAMGQCSECYESVWSWQRDAHNQRSAQQRWWRPLRTCRPVVGDRVVGVCDPEGGGRGVCDQQRVGG
jgi:hypothetical protein